MQKACDIIDLIVEYEKKGSVLAISDASYAASLCAAALEAVAPNVLINTKAMQEREKAEQLNEQVFAMLFTTRARKTWPPSCARSTSLRPSRPYSAACAR